jgi:hypothetical protein
MEFVKSFRILLVLAAVLFVAGCTSPPQETGKIAPAIPPTVPPVVTLPPPVTIHQPVDPIIGSWENGMVVYDNGTVGDDGTMTWKANPDMNDSYFIVTDVPDELDKKRAVTSVEWEYIPASDCIHRRGSAVLVHRV